MRCPTRYRLPVRPLLNWSIALPCQGIGNRGQGTGDRRQGTGRVIVLPHPALPRIRCPLSPVVCSLSSVPRPLVPFPSVPGPVSLRPRSLFPVPCPLTPALQAH